MKKAISTVLLIGALSLSAGPVMAANGQPGDPNCTVIVETITVPEVPAVYKTVIIPAVTEVQYEFAQRNAEQHEENGHGATTRWESDPNWNAQSNPNSQGWDATGISRVVEITPASSTQELVSPAIPARDEANNRLECTEVPEDSLEGYPAPPPVVPTTDGVPSASAQPTDPVAVNATQTADTEQTATLANTGVDGWMILWASVGILALLAGISSVVVVRRNA